MLVALSWLPGGTALYHSMEQGKAAIVNTVLKTAGIHTCPLGDCIPDMACVCHVLDVLLGISEEHDKRSLQTGRLPSAFGQHSLICTDFSFL